MLRVVVLMLRRVILIAATHGLFATGLMQRDAGGDFGASSTGTRSDFESAPEQGRPFPHPQQSHRLGVANFLVRNAAAIIPDFQNDSACAFAQIDFHLRCSRMANDVGKRFLKNAEEGCVQIGTQGLVPEMYAHLTFDAGPGLKFICLPFKCSRQAQMVEHARAQLGRDPTDHLDRGIDVGRQLPGLGQQGLLITRQLARKPRNIQFATGQRLPQFIVHFARDSSALFFANGLKIDRERP